MHAYADIFWNRFRSSQPLATGSVKRSTQFTRVTVLLGSVVMLSLMPSLTVLAQEKDEREAWSNFEVSANAQNDGDYQFAASQWEKLLKDFPDATMIGKATYNLGICYEKLGQHDAAAKEFGKAIPKLVGLEAELQPLAYFYQAYCQFLVGQQLSKKTDAESLKESNIQLTTATKTFDDLLTKFPSFDDADQARFFQGNAYELLKRTDDAIASYKKMLEYAEPHFKFEGLYFLGQLNQEQGKLTEAIGFYDRFRSELKTETHPLLAEVNFSKGKTLLSLAAQQTEKGDATGAVESFRSAEEIFKQLAGLDEDHSTSELREISHEALYQQAFCLANLNQQEQAGEIYERVASRADSPFLVQALVNAGRCYLEAGQVPKAVETLKRSAELDSPLAAEGASLLVRTYLDQGDHVAAYDLAEQWIKKQPASRMAPYLMYDRAEAALKIPSRQTNAPSLFLEVADSFPEHSTAPSAVYSAAYAQFQQNEGASAIATVDRFLKAYPQSELVADCREIKADALLLTDEKGAETEYDQLLEDFPDHERQNRWYLRSAVAKFFQKKYQATIDLLQPRLDQFDEPRQAAEAYHWVGASHFFLDQIPLAISSLEKSVATGQAWRSTDETILTLARAYLKKGQVVQARQMIDRLESEFKESPLIDRGQYYLGEYAYEANEFQHAFESFQRVYTNFPKSELVPSALYNAAWAKLKLNQADESNVLFSRLISDYPSHELAQQAQAGRGAAARKSGNMEDSIKDLKAFVETKTPGEEKFGAMFELALAQIEAKDWEEAVKTLQTLLNEDTKSARVDSYHYELAWVLHELNRVPESLNHFAAITKLTSVSRYAAESYFHVASEAYRTEDFASAEEAYKKSIELATDDVLREKSLYKLGWTYYKQDQFGSAFEQFDKQVSQFPGTSFAADGQFMRAESLFQQKKYAEALQAYLKALPIVKASETIDPKLVFLTHLHGAQSANMSQDFQSALDLALPLTTQDKVTEAYQADAWLEVGTALQGLNRDDEAVNAWENAKGGSDKTSVRARCLVGDHYFKEKQFEKAINEFKEIQYRFGDSNAQPEVKAWVAYALYEAARCYLVQVTDASEEEKIELIKNSIRQFEALLEKYPDDRLATEAKSQLEKLKQIRR